MGFPKQLILVLLASMLALPVCNEDPDDKYGDGSDGDSDGDSDSDSDSDTDADSDMDSDTDADTDSDSDGDCSPPATTEAICEKIFDDCGGWGWPDQTTCEDHFIGDPDYMTECNDEAGYLACMCDCLLIDGCESDFTTCESNTCWGPYCEG